MILIFAIYWYESNITMRRYLSNYVYESDILWINKKFSRRNKRRKKHKNFFEVLTHVFFVCAEEKRIIWGFLTLCHQNWNRFLYNSNSNNIYICICINIIYFFSSLVPYTQQTAVRIRNRKFSLSVNLVKWMATATNQPKWKKG